MAKGKSDKAAPKKPAKRPVGRPPMYSSKLADKLCDRLVHSRSLRSVCEAQDMPDEKTVYQWRLKDSVFRQEFTDKLARAREMQTERLLDEIPEIADDGTNDFGFKEGKDGDGESAFPMFIPEVAARSKLRVEARLKIAAMTQPRKYGPKAEVELSGGLTINIQREVVK